MSDESDRPPEELFHYTSPAGARGILTSATIWASMIHYMNDAQEFRYALGLARDLVLTATGAEEHHRSVCSNFLSAIEQMAVFVFSLTPHKDQLRQWRAYATNGGYAIGFPTEHLKAIADNVGARLARCDYDPDSQRARLMPIVQDMLTESDSIDPAHSLDLYEPFAARFTEAAAAIKHPSFQDEDEWRLVSHIGVDPAGIRYRDAGGLIVPYGEWGIRHAGKYPISTIVVGPTIPADLAARSLHYLTSAVYHWPVKVEFSASTYRPLH
jgi:hypothetical protein